MGLFINEDYLTLVIALSYSEWCFFLLFLFVYYYFYLLFAMIFKNMPLYLKIMT